MSDEGKKIKKYEKEVNLPDAEISQHNLLQSALNNLTPQQKNELAKRAADEALDIEVLKQKMNSQDGAVTRDIQKLIDLINSLEGGIDQGTHIEQDIKTATGSMHIKSRKGATCFVATAVYGNAECEQVTLLRAYRDLVLMNSFPGRLFVGWYYRNGPKLAEFVRSKTLIFKFVKNLLDLFVLMINKFMQVQK